MELYYLCQLVGVSGAGKYAISNKKNVNFGANVVMGEDNYYDYEDDRGSLFTVQIRSISTNKDRLERQATEWIEKEEEMFSQTRLSQSTHFKSQTMSPVNSEPKSPSLLSGLRSQVEGMLIDEHKNESETQFSESLSVPANTKTPVIPKKGAVSQKTRTSARAQRESKKTLHEWNKLNSIPEDDVEDDFPLAPTAPSGVKRKRNSQVDDDDNYQQGKSSSNKSRKTTSGGKPTIEKEIDSLKLEREELQRKVWNLEFENSELKKKIAFKTGTSDSEKIGQVLSILQNAFPGEAADLSGNDKVILGNVDALDENGNSVKDYDGKRKKEEVSIDRDDYRLINFEKPLEAVKILLEGCVGLRALQTHSFSGKKCNSVKDAVRKPQLHPQKVNLVIAHTMKRFKTYKTDGKIHDEEHNVDRALVWADMEEAVKQKFYAAAKAKQ